MNSEMMQQCLNRNENAPSQWCLDHIKNIHSMSSEEAAIQLIVGDLHIGTWRSYRGSNYHDVDGKQGSGYQIPVHGPVPKPVVAAEFTTSSREKPRSQTEKGKLKHGHGSSIQDNGTPPPKPAAKTASFSASSFDARFEELITFKENHGHCNPQVSLSSLGRWCARMRYIYKHYLNRSKDESNQSKWKYKPLKPDQIQRLEAIGFQWSVPKRDDSKFFHRMEELAKFKEIHGHCNVPIKEYNSLGSWCRKVRSSYHHMKKGNFDKMRGGIKITPEREKALDEIGFQFINSPTKTSTTENHDMTECHDKFFGTH